MAPKKKFSSNGFMNFTMEWKKKYGRDMDINEAIINTGEIWKTMNSAERAPYNAKAKEKKEANATKTSTALLVSKIEKEKQASENEVRLMERDIETKIKNCLKSDALENQSYYFAMVNYFTKTNQHNLVLPAEISIAKFSLKKGVIQKYHTFINPGSNIYGYLHEAQKYSAATHQLPLPPNAIGVTSFHSVYNDILNFIKDEETGEYPPVYTDRANISVVNGAFEFLKTDIGTPPVTIKVYSIQYLFFILKEACCIRGEISKPASHYITDAYFDRDYFEYQSGIACAFHEERDRTKYCTQSYVTRWGFVFADYMCGDIAIELIPGRHIPLKKKLPDFVKPPSRATLVRDIPMPSFKLCSLPQSRYANIAKADDLKNLLSSSDEDDNDNDAAENSIGTLYERFYKPNK